MNIMETSWDLTKKKIGGNMLGKTINSMPTSSKLSANAHWGKH